MKTMNYIIKYNIPIIISRIWDIGTPKVTCTTLTGVVVKIKYQSKYLMCNNCHEDRTKSPCILNTFTNIVFEDSEDGLYRISLSCEHEKFDIIYYPKNEN